MEKNIFGNYIKELREQRGLLQVEVAEKINEKEEKIKEWEEEKDYPNLDETYKLADVYSVSCDEMLRMRDLSQKKNAKMSVFFANIVGWLYIVLSKLPNILIVGMAIVAFILLRRALTDLLNMLT